MAGLCSICADARKRRVIDAALSAGATPAATYDEWGSVLNTSRSSIYRHAAHRRGEVDPVFLGDEPKGDVLADLANLARSLYESHRDAKAAGQLAAAARFGAEARQAFGALLAQGIESEDDVDVYQHAERMVGTFLGLLKSDPETLFPAAIAAAQRRGYTAVVDDLERTQSNYLAYEAEKEKAHHA